MITQLTVFLVQCEAEAAAGEELVLMLKGNGDRVLLAYFASYGSVNET